MKSQPTIDRTATENPAADAHATPVDSELPDRFQTSKSELESLDTELINQTKNQIRSLVNEIAELSKTSTDLAQFFEGFLNRTTSALACEGGAIWLDETGQGQLKLQYHINLDQTVLANDADAQMKHTKLLDKFYQNGEAALVPANSGSTDDEEGANPTQNLLILGPIKVNHQTVGLVEIFQRNGAGPTTQRGYLRFLIQMCEIASEFLTNRRIANFSEQQNLWQEIDAFVRAIHQGLNPEQTCYVIANESRRIVGCDRVSVATTQGSRSTIKAVSGLDSIERRADQVKLLQKLVQTTIKTDQPLWYTGADEDLAPQIEKRLHGYLDKSHTKMLAIVPLKTRPQANDTNRDPQKPETIGALIVEQLKDSDLEPAVRRRIELIASHSESALANAVEHHRLFLLPLWKTLGQMAQPFVGRRLPRTILGLGVFASIAAFFALYPYPFSLSANGQLQPQVQNEVFASVGGILQDIYVPEGQAKSVKKNDVLAKMTNSDLMMQIQNLDGQINQTREQISKYQRAQFSNEKLDKLDDIMLDGEFNKAEESLASLKREYNLKKQQAEDLIVRSPVDGVIVNWQVRRSLLKRPVDRGQNLMTIIDPNGGWQLEIEIPERRVGHLMQRLQSSEEPVEVHFALVSHPGQEFVGTLEHVDRKLEVYSDDGNAAKAIISFENQQIPRDLLKSGTRVNAKLYCGTRSIGFVWFHELFETVVVTYKYWF